MAGCNPRHQIDSNGFDVWQPLKSHAQWQCVLRNLLDSPILVSTACFRPSPAGVPSIRPVSPAGTTLSVVSDDDFACDSVSSG